MSMNVSLMFVIWEASLQEVQVARISCAFVFHFDNEMRLHAPNVQCTRVKPPSLMPRYKRNSNAAACQGVTTGGLVP